MSISALKKTGVRRAAAYLAVSLFCGLFAFVYGLFSHGVYSAHMTFMFLYPLAGGALPYGLLALPRVRRAPGRGARNLYNSGVAALTVGSCFAGVLEIYGTTSELVAVYFAAGTALSLAGVLLFILAPDKKPS